jgi:hypothetical protein
MPPEFTEQVLNTQSPVRMRHYYLKLETPIVDVIAGQYYDLFGWGGKGYFPATLAFLGITGQVFHRQPQIRLSKTVGKTLQAELAVAAVRPVQRASGNPDLQAGLRLAYNDWTGARTQGYSQPTIGPLSIGVSGIGRRFEVAQFIEFPGGSNTALGWGVSAHAFIPIIPASNAKRRGNSLSLTGEFSRGTGISDMYTELTGGALFPNLPNPQDRQQPTNPPPEYPPNIDYGIVNYDGEGNLRTIDWQGMVGGLQYYLPIFSGSVWVSGNYSRIQSANIIALTPIPGRGGVYWKSEYYDGNLFIAITDNVHTGFSFQSVKQTLGDEVVARNYRSEFAMQMFF